MSEAAENQGIDCPKCGPKMDELRYGADLLIDRCSNCKGMRFDHGEMEKLKDKWMGEDLDSGSPEEGKKWDAVDDINCPRCGKQMSKTSDPKQPHIWYEVCDEHGVFMDAGEFTDYKHETLADWFRTLIKGSR